MAYVELVNVILQPDGSGSVGKLYPSPTPNAKLGGAFVWCFENQTSRAIKVSLDNFGGYVNVTTRLPLTIGPGQRGVAVGTVINATADAQTVSYSLYVDGVLLDPDIIIDGEGGIKNPKSAKGGETKGGKKKAAKKR